MSTFINAPKIPPLPPEKENERLIADALWLFAATFTAINLLGFTWLLLTIAF